MTLDPLINSTTLAIMYEMFFGGPSPMVGIVVASTLVAGGLLLAWRGMRTTETSLGNRAA